jgi:hypothetical protein
MSGRPSKAEAEYSAAVESAIEHAARLLGPFACSCALRRRDPSWIDNSDAWFKAIKSLDDGRRHTLVRWEKMAAQLPETPHRRGHPSFLFRRAVILLVLDEIVARGFRRRRRSEFEKRESACSVVSKALYKLRIGMTEGQIADLIRPPRSRRRPPN